LFAEEVSDENICIGDTGQYIDRTLHILYTQM